MVKVNFNILLSNGKYIPVNEKENEYLFNNYGVHTYNHFVCFPIAVKEDNFRVVKSFMKELARMLNNDEIGEIEAKEIYRDLYNIYG